MKYLVSAELKEPFRENIERHFRIKDKRASARAEGKVGFEEGDWTMRVVTDSVPIKVIGIIETNKLWMCRYILDYEPVAKFEVTPVYDYGDAIDSVCEIFELEPE